MRADLVALSIVELDNCYGYELLHSTGIVYGIRRIDTPNRLTCTTMDTALALAKYLKFSRYSVRLKEVA